MSPIASRLLLGVGLALVLLSCSVDAHAWLSNPKPRGQYLSPPKASWEEYKPAAHNPNDTNFVCRNDPASPKATWVPMRAGEKQSFTISFNALHVGDCFVYLTYDGDKATSEQKWFKIWEQHSCKDQSEYSVTIPSYLPSGEHVVFRWEWYALHIYPTVEYFASCFDATITGSANGVLPQPQVNMPGHLPLLDGSYAARTNNYWWPWDDQPMFFTGPPVATVGGQTTTTAPDTKATPPPAAATTKPSPTNAPSTYAPSTKAPSTYAPSTKAPSTNAPSTKAPSTNAPATKAPSTNAPATKAPATNAPVIPKVTVAPAQSVKLAVLEACSIWWVAVVPTGHRTGEITKMEFTDSSNYVKSTAMSIGWANVWTFSPGAQGPVTYPLTVKASLASGSSVTFIVNNPLATLVDSGAIFQ